MLLLKLHLNVRLLLPLSQLHLRLLHLLRLLLLVPQLQCTLLMMILRCSFSSNPPTVVFHEHRRGSRAFHGVCVLYTRYVESAHDNPRVITIRVRVR